MQKAAKSVGPLRWLLGLLISMSFLTLTVGTGLWLKNWARNKFIAENAALLLEEQNPANSQFISSQFESPMAALRLVGIDPKLEDTITNILEVHRNIQKGDFARAAKIYEVVLRYSRFSLITTLGANQQAARRLGIFKRYLDFADGIASSLARVQTKLRSADDEISTNIEQYKLAAQDLQEFLNLTTPLSISVSDCDSCTYYQTGILEGIAKIPEIPQDVANGEEFKTRLASIGGEVKLSGPSAPQDFQAKINQLREQANSIKDKCKQIQSSVARAREIQPILRDRLRKAKKNALIEVRHLLELSLK